MMELKPVPLDRMHPSYPKEIVQRALELMGEHRSVHAAQVALKEEMADKGLVGPSYNALWRWAQEKDTLLERLQGGRKDQLVAVASEVALKASERMLTALDGISDSQVPVAYGIAMQKRTEWENTGSKGNQMNVQFNWVTRE
jgi:hypothetical protein